MDRNKKDIRLVTDEKIAETSSKGNQEKWFDADSNHRQSSKMYIGKTKVFAMTSLQGLWKKLCKQYLTKLDKAKITGISLI